MYILQSDSSIVYQIFAVSRTVIPPCHSHLIAVELQRPVASFASSLLYETPTGSVACIVSSVRVPLSDPLYLYIIFSEPVILTDHGIYAALPQYIHIASFSVL